MLHFNSPWWKKTPVFRLALPFFLGIVQQWYWTIPVNVLLGLAIINTGVLSFSLHPNPFFGRYKLGFINGLSAFLLFAALGGLSVWQQNIQNNSLWHGNIDKETDAWIIKMHESPAEKSNTLRANAAISALVKNSRLIPAAGGIFVHFPRNVAPTGLKAGDLIITRKPPQPIRPNTSPGAFNFQRYALFRGITHQVFLREEEYLHTGSQTNPPRPLIPSIRQWILQALQKSFPDKKERGLAEALLIGYREELDKSLLQAYTNTGIVHIIAISGLHLGLIYGLLLFLLKPLNKTPRLKWLRPWLIICGLWLFAFLAGAQPSVLRSALMFSCLIMGELLSRKPNSYNSLALSALILASYNPFWLWEPGFQLSYAAITGILAFSKPIYRCLSFRNKIVDQLWQLNAVTLSAQILTIPLCIYHFHQFPNYFLVANLLAVPLVSLILITEIMTCALFFVPQLMILAGKCSSGLIRLMNRFIEGINTLPFATWQDLQINLPQAAFLMIFFVSACSFLFKPRNKRLNFYWSLFALCCFMMIRAGSFIKAGQQRMIVVFQNSAAYIRGRDCISTSTVGAPGDLLASSCRTIFRLRAASSLPGLLSSGPYVSFGSRKILILDGNKNYQPGPGLPQLDLLLLTGKPVQDAVGLCSAMDIRQIVAGTSLPSTTIRHWQSQCDSLKIPFHSVKDKGAFVMNF